MYYKTSYSRNLFLGVESTSVAAIVSMDRIKLTVQNLGQVFNSRPGCACIHCAFAYIIKHPKLKLKTWPKQLLGYLPFAFAFPLSVTVNNI